MQSCLKYTITINKQDAKVVRLNNKGDIIQTIQYDDNGAAIYSWRIHIISLQTGQIVIVDKYHMSG